uniref:Pre-C2HC domain-containing protein n=1 Tax=Schizaphis graminum TaxID=13262 RepID=A0A2S2PU62_SCHGA
MIKTQHAAHFRFIQKTLIDYKILFQTSNLPEDRTLKVIIKGIPTDISTKELKSELELLNFDIKLMKRFGPAYKPLPICLVILGNAIHSKHIYELTNLFYIKVSVQTYKKSGPSQYCACQRATHGHSSSR